MDRATLAEAIMPSMVQYKGLDIHRLLVPHQAVLMREQLANDRVFYNHHHLTNRSLVPTIPTISGRISEFKSTGLLLPRNKTNLDLKAKFNVAESVSRRMAGWFFNVNATCSFTRIVDGRRPRRDHMRRGRHVALIVVAAIRFRGGWWQVS